MSNISKQCKSGQVILSVWDNEVTKDGHNMIIPNITISRLYQKDGKWHHGNNFREKDVKDVKVVIEEYLSGNINSPESN
ncbi:MAG: hypothetical protein PHP17_00365 [Candidatus Omnitrophica bacterium]|nr:hypothetical protein [Candidatus Omnitrophota bacterium]